MALRLIAHEINKNPHSKEVYVKYRETVILSDEFAQVFLDEVRKGITQKNPTSGRFSKPADVMAPFQTRVIQYLEARTEEGFIALSKSLTAHLEGILRDVPLATGGYVLFAEHEYNGEQYLLVLILSAKAKASFNEKLDLQASKIIDLEHLRHAARIHVGEVVDNPDGVVKFVSREAKGTADYFTEFLGCEAVSDSSEQGRLLKLALGAECPLFGIDADVAMQKTFGYWKQCKDEGQPMQLTTLAAIIHPEDAIKFANAIGDEKYRLAGEFDVPPARVMSRFIKFSFRSKTLLFEFDKSTWIDKVAVVGQTVTITNAPPALLKQIEESKSEG